MTAFFRFPHTPHLVWLGEAAPREDKVLSLAESRDLIAAPVVVEEKIDGANIGISVSADGDLLVQNRGQYLAAPYSGQFARLAGWLDPYRIALVTALGRERILFGEWCAARHSIWYRSLPSWFVVFDVYDRAQQAFWSSTKRNDLAQQLGLVCVPRVLQGRTTLRDLKALVHDAKSAYGADHVEGCVIRSESGNILQSRAKIVRPDFLQDIDVHWRRRPMEWNRLAS